jgi:hypothetical protein
LPKILAVSAVLGSRSTVALVGLEFMTKLTSNRKLNPGLPVSRKFSKNCPGCAILKAGPLAGLALID